MDEDELYQQIRERFGVKPEKFSVLQEEIDIALQMEYFEFSRKQKSGIDPEYLGKSKDALFDPEFPQDEKKILLVQLASIDKIWAYRAIEEFTKLPDNELSKWAILALQESRMIIENSLLDENQVFISTGLGGKGSKLRYFIVLTANNQPEFTQIQQKIVEKEFDFVFKNYDSEIEEINFTENICTILTIIPLNVPLKKIFKEIVEECNQMGNFLNNDFIVTNVRKLTNGEIKKYLDNKKTSDNEK
jgi:hypothetical protein